MSSKKKNRHSGRVRLHRRRRGAPAGAASRCRDHGAHRQHPCRQGDGRGVSAFLHARPAAARRMGEGRLDRARRGVLRAAARHHAGDHRRGAGRQSGHQDHRHVGGLPAARHEHLRAMVRPRAPRAGAAGRGGLRPDRVLSGEDHRGAAGRLSRLLSDRGAAGAGAAREGQADRRRRHRHRREIRRHRRGPRPQAEHAVQRSRRGAVALFDRRRIGTRRRSSRRSALRRAPP